MQTKARRSRDINDILAKYEDKHKAKSKLNPFSPKVIEKNGQKTVKRFPVGAIVFVVFLIGLFTFAWSQAPVSFDANGLETFGNNFGNFFNWELEYTDGAGLTHSIYSPDDRTNTLVNSATLLLNSIMVSLIGVVIGAFFALPTAVAGSELMTKSGSVKGFTRVLMVIGRTFPFMVMIIVFQNFFTSDLNSVIVLSVFVWAILSKWMMDAIDQLNPGPVRSLEAMGLSKGQVFKYALWPQISKHYTSMTLFSFEVAVKFTAIFGVLGMSTIGQAFNLYPAADPAAWGQLSVAITFLIGFIMLTEALLWVVKKYIINAPGKRLDKEELSEENILLRVSGVRKKKPVGTKIKWVIFGSLIGALFVVSLSQMNFGMTSGSEEYFAKLEAAGGLLAFVPDLSVFTDPGTVNLWANLINALGITAMAFFISIMFAIPLGLLASKNVTGHASAFFKGIISVIRAFPSMLWVYIFITISVANQFSFAGAMALGFMTVGSLSKQVYGVADNLDKSTINVLKAQGNGWWNVLRFGVMPSMMPATVATSFERLELNFRQNANIGMVGASMFGYQMRVLFNDPSTYGKGVTYTITIVLVSLAIEKAARTISTRMKEGPKPREYGYWTFFIEKLSLKFNIKVGNTKVLFANKKDIHLNVKLLKLEKRLAKIDISKEEKTLIKLNRIGLIKLAQVDSEKAVQSNTDLLQPHFSRMNKIINAQGQMKDIAEKHYGHKQFHFRKEGVSNV